jgi:hypothetical protein
MALQRMRAKLNQHSQSSMLVVGPNQGDIDVKELNDRKWLIVNGPTKHDLHGKPLTVTNLKMFLWACRATSFFGKITNTEEQDKKIMNYPLPGFPSRNTEEGLKMLRSQNDFLSGFFKLNSDNTSGKNPGEEAEFVAKVLIAFLSRVGDVSNANSGVPGFRDKSDDPVTREFESPPVTLGGQPATFDTIKLLIDECNSDDMQEHMKEVYHGLLIKEEKLEILKADGVDKPTEQQINDVQVPEAIVDQIKSHEPPCKFGDIIFSPMFICGDPRKGKSIPMLLLVTCMLSMKQQITISVAPDKTTPLIQLVAKIHDMNLDLLGWNVVTTLPTPKRKKNVDPAVNHLDVSANVFIYSSDEETDVNLYEERVALLHSKKLSMVHVHDETQTIAKKPDGSTEAFRRYYSNGFGLRVLVGATHLPILQLSELFGSQLTGTSAVKEVLGDVNVNFEDLMRPFAPIEPQGGIQYNGMESTHAITEWETGPGVIYTKQKVLDRATDLCLNSPVNEERAQQEERRAAHERSLINKPDAMENIKNLKSKRLFYLADGITFDMEKVNAHREREAAKHEVAASVIRSAMTNRAATRAYILNTFEKELDTPTLSPFLEGYLKSPVNTAKIELFYESALNEKSVTQIKQDKFYNKLTIMAVTQKINGNDGCCTWASRFLDIAEKLGKTVTIMLYATGIPKNSVGTVFPGCTAAQEYESTKAVKCLSVRPVYDSSGTFQMTRRTVNTFDSAQDALKWIHDPNLSSLQDLLAMHVLAIGYNMFRAATTIAANLTYKSLDPSSPEIKILYIAARMALAHDSNKQLDALYQLLGRLFSELKEYAIPGFQPSILCAKETPQVTRAYAEGERYLAQLLRESGNPNNPYQSWGQIYKALDEFFKDQDFWDGNLSEKLLGLRRVKVSDQMKDTKHVGGNSAASNLGIAMPVAPRPALPLLQPPLLPPPPPPPTPPGSDSDDDNDDATHVSKKHNRGNNELENIYPGVSTQLKKFESALREGGLNEGPIDFTTNPHTGRMNDAGGQATTRIRGTILQLVRVWKENNNGLHIQPPSIANLIDRPWKDIKEELCIGTSFGNGYAQSSTADIKINIGRWKELIYDPAYGNWKHEPLTGR